MENNVGAGAEGGLNLPAVYLALLRGINVGGKNRVPMAQLEGIFRAAGCTDVTTYIQSDHVIFRNEDRLVSRVPEFVSAEIADSLGLQVPVLLRTGIEGRHIRLTVESAGRGSSRGGEG